VTKIGVLGLGNWGTALANIWAKDGHSVIGWTVETEVYESMVLNNVNAKYLPDVKLPGVDATLDIGEVCDASELLILAIPSGVILSVVDQLLPHLRPSHVLVDLAKGIAPEEEGESGLISAAIEKRLNGVGLTNPVVVLTGPTIAPEVARGVLTNALVAAHDRSVAERVASRLSTDTLILKAADDPVGAELWGAFKNTIALACGIVDGLRDGIGGDNLKAALVPIGFAEGRKLLILLGAEEETSLGPAGLGDLYVTSTSPRSRNRTLGQKLGEGKSLEEGLAEMHMVVEGVRAARMFRKKASQVGCPAPFIESLNILLDGDITAEECVRSMVEQSL
jgi:glycerol-3-phosphate dehydrogenase (NAD(P)+)